MQIKLDAQYFQSSELFLHILALALTELEGVNGQSPSHLDFNGLFCFIETFKVLEI